MRALTVQQPWAWAIVHGGKDVENRTQAWSYRGPLAIHAGARWSDRGAHDVRVARACARSWPVPPASDMLESTARSIARHGLEPSLYPHTIARMSAIVGVVDLVAVHSEWDCMGGPTESMCSPWGETACRGSHEDVCPASVRLNVHLVLEHPLPLEVPIPAKGRLGLWTPDAELLAAIREQVPA